MSGRTVQVEGTQPKGRNDMPLKATDCPEESPEELTWNTIPLFSSSPASPSLASTCAGSLGYRLI